MDPNALLIPLLILLPVIMGVVMLNFGADPVLTLSPSLVDTFGHGDEAVGYLITAFGVGAVTVTVTLRVLRRFMTLRVSGIVGYLVAAAGLGFVSVTMELGPALVGFFINGAGFMMANVSVNTRIQRRVPEELRGRVMALWGLAFLGCRPIAALISGWVADEFGLAVALLMVAVLTAFSAMFSRVSYRTAG